MAGCSKWWTKTILNIFNGLLFLVGLVPLIFGAIALASEDVLNTILALIPGATVIGDIVINSATYLVILGVVVCVVAGLGLFGTCCKNKCFLYLYLVALLLIIAAEIAVVVLALAFPDTFSTETQKLMVKTLDGLEDCSANNIGENHELPCGDKVVSLAWHSMQYELKCCGAKDLTDYGSANWTSRTDDSIAPLTCCRRVSGDKFPPKSSEESPDCYPGSSIATDYFEQGCFDAVLNWVASSPIVIGVLVGIGTLELILVASTLVQICADKRRSGNGSNN